MGRNKMILFHLKLFSFQWKVDVLPFQKALLSEHLLLISEYASSLFKRRSTSFCSDYRGIHFISVQELLDKPQMLFALILSPTRELAIQIAGQFEALGSIISVKCACLVGGIDMMQQAIALGKRPHILVGTPGRVVDHLSNTKVSSP